MSFKRRHNDKTRANPIIVDGKSYDMIIRTGAVIPHHRDPVSTRKPPLTNDEVFATLARKQRVKRQPQLPVKLRPKSDGGPVPAERTNHKLDTAKRLTERTRGNKWFDDDA